MTEIDRINDKFFKKTFSDLENTRAFLEIEWKGTGHRPKNTSQFTRQCLAAFRVFRVFRGL